MRRRILPAVFLFLIGLAVPVFAGEEGSVPAPEEYSYAQEGDASEEAAGFSQEDMAQSVSAGYALADNDLFSFEYPADRVTWNAEGTQFVSPDGAETEPLFFVERTDTSLSAGEYIVERKAAYEQTYRERMAKPPEIITIQVPDTTRSISGFTANASSSEGSRTFTTVELVEDLGGMKYHYYCCYVSHSNEDGSEDTVTYDAFLHAINTLAVK